MGAGATTDLATNRLATDRGVLDHVATRAAIDRLQVQLFAGLLAVTAITLAAMRLWL